MLPTRGAAAPDNLVLPFDGIRFAWIGDPDEDGPLYAGLRSPVAPIEFDHHPDIVITAEEPQSLHVHTIVRMPNACDYGRALVDRCRERGPQG